MQVAVSEFARHVAGMEGANSTEMDPETPFPVIDLLPEQKEIADMGGTMRLGADPVKLHDGTRVRELYGEPVVYERHRHRYEVNNHLRKRLRIGRARVLGHLARRAAGRGDRAGPRTTSVLRGLAVPPGVQVASGAAGAAVPGVRRRGAGHAHGVAPAALRIPEAAEEPATEVVTAAVGAEPRLSISPSPAR